MPFKSKKQQGYMFSQHPKIAKKWAKETDFNKLECEEPQPVAMERIPGGKGESHDPGEFDQTQLMKGIHHEMEHTEDVVAAMEIAMDHLIEDPKYYDHIDDMEKQVKKTIEKEKSLPNLSDVYVSPHQAHLDDGDMDPFDTGIDQPRRRIKFGGSGPKISNTGV